MAVVIDTNYLFALKAKQDKNHKRSIELMDDLKENYNEPIFTNNLVISELLTLVNSRFKGNAYYLDEFYKLVWGDENFFTIFQLLPDHYKEGYKILKKYTTPERLLSYVDASLIFLNKKINAKALVSFDSHFDGIISRLY